MIKSIGETYLLAFDWFSSNFGEENLDKVDRVDETSKFDQQRNVDGEKHEVVVQEINHAHSCVDLRSKLTNNNSNYHVCDTILKEDRGDNLG